MPQIISAGGGIPEADGSTERPAVSALYPRLNRRTLLAGTAGLVAASAAGVAAVPAAAAAPRGHTTSHAPKPVRLRSRPETVQWGYFDAAQPPVLWIKPGDVVTIDTLSHHGVINGTDPVTFFGRYGIPRSEVLQDQIDLYATKKPEPGMSVHVLTGPVYVAGAEPGDVLEVRVLDVQPRVPYGVNRTGPGSGVLPTLLTEQVTKVIPLDLQKRVARFAKGVNVPIDSFMGIMCTAPAPALGRVSSRPPGPYGGNMDLRDLTAGATVYLPVFNPGALFSTGDGHSAQGDGEVDGTAIETSLVTTMQFFVHKAVNAPWPMAERSTHYITMGIDTDLEVALAIALQEAVDFLGGNMGMSPADAYALCSIAVDFEIAEAVNFTKVVHGRIPKSLFDRVPRYWWRED